MDGIIKIIKLVSVVAISVILSCCGQKPKVVSQEKMQSVYEQIKTPYKYGVVVRPPQKDMLVDSPSVFQKDGKWFMLYVLQDGAGYSTHLAESDNLLDWHYKGEVLKRKNNSDWDGQQTAGYIALQNTNWNGDWSIAKFNGKYWMSYLGGALTGYETDPLSIGMAFTENPTQAKEWNRFQKPILAPSDNDSRHFEKLTLYKSNVIIDEKRSLGANFVMFYNCKTKTMYERIAMAVSDDMKTWRRYGKETVIDAGSGISGDPQVVKIGDVWVMFYFNAGCKNFPNGAFDTFACSYDLVNWTDWQGEPLVKPTEKFDTPFAHKPYVVHHKGVVYHFYCAVGDQGRVIALATSKNLKKTNNK